MTVSPDAASGVPTAGCGCGAAPSTDPATTEVSPCCGSSRAARAAGACCDPAAKELALAEGATCCG